MASWTNNKKCLRGFECTSAFFPLMFNRVSNKKQCSAVYIVYIRLFVSISADMVRFHS